MFPFVYRGKVKNADFVNKNRCFTCILVSQQSHRFHVIMLYKQEFPSSPSVSVQLVSIDSGLDIARFR